MIAAWLLSFILLLSSALGQECISDGVCDTHERCPVWKEEGECELSSNYMKRYCPASCYAEEEPEDEKQRVAKESEEFGLLQEAVGSSADKTLDIIRLSIEYMKTKETGEACSNKHKYCSFWAVIGECEKNTNWMATNCGPACINCL